MCVCGASTLAASIRCETTWNGVLKKIPHSALGAALNDMCVFAVFGVFFGGFQSYTKTFVCGKGEMNGFSTSSSS